MENNNISIFLLNCHRLTINLVKLNYYYIQENLIFCALMKPGLTGLNQSSLTMFQYGNIEENQVEDLE